MKRQNLIRNFNCALICTVDLDPSQCVHKAPSVASQTQQLHNHISKGDHVQDLHSTAGLHLAGMADVKGLQWVRGSCTQHLTPCAVRGDSRDADVHVTVFTTVTLQTSYSPHFDLKVGSDFEPFTSNS